MSSRSRSRWKSTKAWSTIKSDARAYLETNILSGVSTIQIRGGTTEAADLTPEAGHKYPVIEAGQSELERVKATLPELLGSLKDAAHSLDTMLNAQNREAITETIANVRTVTATAAKQSKEVNEILSNASASILQLTALLRDLDESYSARGGLKDQASQTLADYDRVAKNLSETTRQLQSVIDENRRGIRDFTQRTLPDVGDLVSGVQRLVEDVTRFVAEIERDPTRLLYGERREGYRPR